MTIKELIEHLQTFDPELYVFVHGYEGGVNYFHKRIKIVDVELNQNTAWYYGKHELAEDINHLDKFQIVKAIIL